MRLPFCLLLPILPMAAQAPPAVVQAVGSALPPAVQSRVDQLLSAKDWPALADYLESLPPRQRGALLETWLRSLNKSGRFERLLQVCDAAIPQMEAGQGPRLTTARLFRAQALSGLERHAEAMAAHAENGRLGFPAGFESACGEARVLQDWTSLAALAGELAKTRPGLGLSLKGEALAKQLNFAEAEPVLAEAVKLEGHTAMAWADLACCLVQRQAYQEAIEAAARALALEPRNLEALYNRGRARFGLHQYQEGREDLAAALATGQADTSMAQNMRHNIELADRYLAYAKGAGKPKSSRKAAPTRNMQPQPSGGSTSGPAAAR